VKSVVSNPETGIFVIKKAPVGIVTLEVSAEGYTDKKEVVVVKKDETIIKNITLSPKKKGTGIISGKVIAKESGSPLGAEIIFPDLGLKTTSDLVRGIYKLEVPIGTHTVCVKSEGYIEQSLPVVIKSDETTLQNFELVKKGASIILPGINFESGKARILPSSRPALEKAAQILRQHPRLRVEIQGHTDSVGSESYNLRLSRARANAVRQYLIQHFKIDPKRLIAKGYGESQPIAENTTREGRAKNRRIEFVLLE
jgi:outer membrane protein OmpA-like peptidoglycan-associated protein